MIIRNFIPKNDYHSRKSNSCFCFPAGCFFVCLFLTYFEQVYNKLMSHFGDNGLLIYNFKPKITDVSLKEG